MVRSLSGLVLIGCLAACPAPDRPAIAVVGGGPAGMAAALEATAGATVSLVEREHRLGGAGLLGAGITSVPEPAELRRWNEAAGGENPVRTRYAERVRPDAIEWLGGLGVSFRPAIDPLGEATLFAPEGGGGQATAALVRALDAAGVGVRLGLGAVDLQRRTAGGWDVALSDGAVLSADAVILATGGFAANLPRVRERLGIPPGVPLLSGAPAFSDGRGLDLALRVGGIEQAPAHVVLYAHGIPGPRDHALVLLQHTDRVLAVDRDARPIPGIRSPRGESGADLVSRPGGLGWALGGRSLMQAIELWDPVDRRMVPAIDVARSHGLVSPDLDGIARVAGIDPVALGARAATELAPDPAGYAAVPLQATTAKCVTGLETDSEGRVLDAAGRPIPGLYAAGEIAGFHHLHDGLVLDSTMVAAAWMWGRYAGRAAIRDAAEGLYPVTVP